MAESLKSRVRHAANRLLHPLGLHLARRDRAFEMDGLLARAAARGVQVGTWIDVGASDGSWSLRAKKHFPAARFLLFEPLAERQSPLAALTRRHAFVIAAAALTPTDFAGLPAHPRHPAAHANTRPDHRPIPPRKFHNPSPTRSHVPPNTTRIARSCHSVRPARPPPAPSPRSGKSNPARRAAISSLAALSART